MDHFKDYIHKNVIFKEFHYHSCSGNQRFIFGHLFLFHNVSLLLLCELYLTVVSNMLVNNTTVENVFYLVRMCLEVYNISK